MNARDRRTMRRISRELENKKANAKRERDMNAHGTFQREHYAAKVDAYDTALRIIETEFIGYTDVF